MKKELFVSVVLIGMVLLSCKKESTGISKPVDPLLDKLEAWFKFDQDYKDYAAKVMNGTPSGTVSFTTDRNGNASKAMKFDGGSKFTIAGINRKTQMSISAWVKYEISQGLMYFLSPMGEGPAFFQEGNKYGGAVSHPATNSVYSGAVDGSWHHLAVSFDGSDIRFYIDGVLFGTKNHPGTITESPNDFVLGFNNNSYWKGSIDDFRVYSKTLTAADVQKLAGL